MKKVFFISVLLFFPICLSPMEECSQNNKLSESSTSKKRFGRPNFDLKDDETDCSPLETFWGKNPDEGPMVENGLRENLAFYFITGLRSSFEFKRRFATRDEMENDRLRVFYFLTEYINFSYHLKGVVRRQFFLLFDEEDYRRLQRHGQIQEVMKKSEGPLSLEEFMSVMKVSKEPKASKKPKEKKKKKKKSLFKLPKVTLPKMFKKKKKKKRVIVSERMDTLRKEAISYFENALFMRELILEDHKRRGNALVKERLYSDEEAERLLEDARKFYGVMFCLCEEKIKELGGKIDKDWF